ncbi:MAG: hypothetical protein JXO44_06695 [Clostridia bacterium]|nr:hypothetical protein [Clostridia bacterium]
MFKKIISLVLSLFFMFTSTLTFADSTRVESGTIITPYATQNEMSVRTVSYFYEYDEISFKEGVRGSAVRVSDTVRTGPNETATITLTKEKEASISWGVSISAEAKKFIGGTVGFDVNKSIKTQMGYSLTCGENRITYLEATPIYNVSKGTLRIYQGQRLIATKKITLKSPSHYEYKLH